MFTCKVECWGERFHLLAHSVYAGRARTGKPEEGRSQEFHPGLPRGWQEPKSLSYHLPGHIGIKLDPQCGEARTQSRARSIPSCALTSCTTSYHFFCVSFIPRFEWNLWFLLSRMIIHKSLVKNQLKIKNSCVL